MVDDVIPGPRMIAAAVQEDELDPVRVPSPIEVMNLKAITHHKVRAWPASAHADVRMLTGHSALHRQLCPSARLTVPIPLCYNPPIRASAHSKEIQAVDSNRPSRRSPAPRLRDRKPV